jgi:hypothetical protein
MDYKNGQIYAIRSYKSDLFYIGSTCTPLAKRLYCHRLDYDGFLNGTRHYVTSYEILKFDDAFIELLEEFPCENKKQLCKREGQLIRSNDKCVNKRVEGRTNAEYYLDHLERIKAYVLENKDIRKEKRDTKRQAERENPITCECGKTYTSSHIRRHEKSLLHTNYLQSLVKL